MKIKLFLALTGAWLGFSKFVYADSPLTSTDINQAYQDVAIVKAASEAAGKLTPELMDYLIDSANPVDVKIALINALGWNSDEKDNSAIFFEYLNQNNGYKNSEKFLGKADADLLICIAYLKAMDNYFEVDDAIVFAQKAKAKNKNSYAVNIICALIQAQKAQNEDWCEVYKLTNNVRLDNSLTRDMREEAIGIIFEYMDLYKDECR